MTNVVTALLLLGALMSIGGCRRQVPTAVAQPAPVVTGSSADSTVTSRPAAGEPVSTVLPGKGATASAIPTDVAQLDFTYLTTRSKLAFKSPQQEIDNATVSFRLQKDSLIWASISKLGIEAVRVLIARDSVRLLDKINRQYAVSDFTTLSRQFGVPMSFELLQALIVGNLPMPQQPAQVITDQPAYRLLRQINGKTQIDNYVGVQNHKLEKLVLTEPTTQNTLRLEYGDFTNLAAFLFPYSSQLMIDFINRTDGQRSQTSVTIRHNKVELTGENPGFPFTVPASYQRRP